MELDSRLANLSLGEIASLLSPKQQEVLLASISVAASLIQQIQQEDAMNNQQQDNLISNNKFETTATPTTQQQHTPNVTPYHHNRSINQQQQQHHQHQQQHQLHNNGSLNLSHQTDLMIDGETDDDDQDLLTNSRQYNSEELDETDEGERDSFTAHHQHRQYHQDNLEETDEKDLLIIRQFAEELKQRRKSIRLSQKGAAQSLRAFTGGVQPCTDAIIYHFENLQLEPERAMQLIPLLRDWLEWAEKHRINGKQLPMMSAVTKVPRERKRKVVLFNEKAKQYLEDAFLKNNHPDRYQLDVISQELNIPTRSIRKWFTNRRQRKRFAEKFSPVG